MPSSTQGWSESSINLSKDLLRLQEERVGAYADLNSAHSVYLDSGPEFDFDSYKKKVAEATQSFQNISKGIMKTREAFETTDKDPEMANLITRLQLGEEKKLKFTVECQLAAEQARASPEDDLLQRNFQGVQKQLYHIVDEINDALEEIRYHIHDKTEQ